MDKGESINMLKNEIGTITRLCDSLRDEYKSRFFQPADEKETQQWERENNIKIPESYQEWLCFSNGAVIRGNLAYFYGAGEFEVGNPDYPEDFVVIGDLIGDGERLGFSKTTGKILRLNHGRIREYEDFSSFLNKMVIRMLNEYMPFEKEYEKMIHATRRSMVYEFNKMVVSERKEYLRSLYEKSADVYNDFIDDLRDIAVQDFWTNERKLIQQGECTRDWLPEQIETIYNINEKTGKCRIYGGAAMFLDGNGRPVTKRHGTNAVSEVYEGHHMLSVDKYPEHAGDCRNMQALGRSNHEHINAHKGNYQNSTSWYYGYEDGKYYKIGK